MSKKITVTLSDAAERYFNEVAGTLDFGNGVPTQSQVISHCLEELKIFEQLNDDSLTSFMVGHFGEDYHKAIGETNPF